MHTPPGVLGALGFFLRRENESPRAGSDESDGIILRRGREGARHIALMALRPGGQAAPPKLPEVGALAHDQAPSLLCYEDLCHGEDMSSASS